MPLHEGKTFHQYTDRWKAAQRYAIRPTRCGTNPVAASVGSLPARVPGDFPLHRRAHDDRGDHSARSYLRPKGTCEKTPWERPDATALVLCAVFNSFAFDWCIRRKIAASVSLFMLNGCPAPVLSKRSVSSPMPRCAYRAVMRASRDYGGSNSSAATSPGLRIRATLRAAIDAVVAHGYGLERNDYRHILRGFSHKVHPRPRNNASPNLTH